MRNLSYRSRLLLSVISTLVIGVLALSLGSHWYVGNFIEQELTTSMLATTGKTAETINIRFKTLLIEPETEDELLALAARMVRPPGIVTAVILILVSIAIAQASRRLTRPLLDPASRAQEIAAGNPAVKAQEAQSHDEFGKLTADFNDMATQLTKRDTEVREAEARYRGIFENALEGIFQITPEGRCLNANPAIARMLGYDSPHEFIAAITDIARQLYVHPEDRDAFLAMLSGRGEVHGFEAQVYRRDRQKIWVSITARIVRDDGTGRGFFIEGLLSDITERKKSEEELQKAHEELEAQIQERTLDLSKTNELLQTEIAGRRRVLDELEFRNIILTTQQETSIDAMLVVDEVATIISYNQRFIELWHIPLDMASAKDDAPVLQLVTSQTADPIGFITRVKYLYEHKEEKSREEILLKDGRVIDRYSAPMLASNGKYYGRVWYFRDITGRKHAEQSLMNRTMQLETANVELRQVTRDLETAYNDLKIAQSRILQQEKMASIGQLAAGVAHEINNPMGFIMSNLNCLQKYTERLVNFIAIQSAAIETLSFTAGAGRIMEDLRKQKELLRFDYLLADLDNLLKESMDGAERVKKIVQDLKGFSRIDEAEFKMADINRGIESTINIIWNELKYKTTLKKEYGDIPQTKCNLGQLNQVFMNILLNAAQAIQTQGEIAVRTGSDNGTIAVTISDTGMGIPADKLKRIFEPFYTTKEVGKGTGLGLSIAYDIIKKHNGEIRVASEVGKGTVFTVVVPVVEE